MGVYYPGIMMREAIALRPATDADRDFLYNLHITTMREYITATWGWDEAYQQRYFNKHFNPAQRLVVVADGVDIGAFWMEITANEVHLAILELAPDYLRQGIGTHLVGRCISAARRRGMPESLLVLRSDTSAQRLYTRLGFRETQDPGVNLHMMKMTWNPAEPPGNSASP